MIHFFRSRHGFQRQSLCFTRTVLPDRNEALVEQRSRVRSAISKHIMMRARRYEMISRQLHIAKSRMQHGQIHLRASQAAALADRLADLRGGKVCRSSLVPA